VLKDCGFSIIMKWPTPVVGTTSTPWAFSDSASGREASALMATIGVSRPRIVSVIVLP
jgi:hypothetical protein